jgi:hypothetical protein
MIALVAAVEVTRPTFSFVRKSESRDLDCYNEEKCRVSGALLVGLDGFWHFGEKPFRATFAMVRIVLRWIDSPWAFELSPGLNKLGRNPTNDFRISDPSVSSFHVELMVKGEDIRVRDLGSTNGTFIDDCKIEEGTLKPENILRLGNVRFHLEEVSVTPVAHPTSPEAAVQEARKEMAACCINHPAVPAAFKCENCGKALCQDCVKVVGQGKFEATTICSVCQGQCHPLPHLTPPPAPARGRPLLDRLTRTLRIPFTR